MDTLMILSAKYLYLVVILLAAVFFLFQKRKIQKQMLLFAVISMPLSYLIAKIAGHFYYDTRPFLVYHITPLIPHAATNGFPSDHALISVAVAALLFVFSKKWGLLAGAMALLVGESRVYVWVHSPVDIVGSFVIAIVVAAVVRLLLAKYLPKESRE